MDALKEKCVYWNPNCIIATTHEEAVLHTLNAYIWKPNCLTVLLQKLIKKLYYLILRRNVYKEP